MKPKRPKKQPKAKFAQIKFHVQERALYQPKKDKAGIEVIILAVSNDKTTVSVQFPNGSTDQVSTKFIFPIDNQ